MNITRCPFCLIRDTLFKTYTISKEEESTLFKCNNCLSSWKIYSWREKWQHVPSYGLSVKN